MALSSPILSCLSRPRGAALRLALGRSGGGGRDALGARAHPGRGAGGGAGGHAPAPAAQKGSPFNMIIVARLVEPSPHDFRSCTLSSLAVSFLDRADVCGISRA